MKKENIFTVENAKVANAGYSYYPVDREGYIYDGDGIVFVKVKDVDINLKTKEVVTRLVDITCKEYVRNGIFQMYSNPFDYEKGRAMVKYDTKAENLIRNCKGGLGFDQWVSIPNDTDDDGCTMGYVAVWTFEDGEAKETPVVVNRIHNDEIADGNIPDKFWTSKEQAFANNEYKVIDEDGEEFIEQGIEKRLALTDEQREIIKEWEEVYKKALDAGVRFLWDRDNCGYISVYNSKEVDDFDYEAGQFRNGDCFNACDVKIESTIVDFYDYCSSDYYVFSMKPTARQMKAWLKEHPEDAK